MPDRDARRVGAQIASRRQALDLTQQQLAAELDVSPSTVANWERGASYPAKKLGKIEVFLGISLRETGNSGPSPGLRAQIVAEYDPHTAARIIALIEAATAAGEAAPARHLRAANGPDT